MLTKSSSRKLDGKELITRFKKTIQKGTLVEVDFGHISAVGRNGERKTNKRYPDTVQRWEMHKRRLCIVIKHVKDRLFVVPLSSQKPEGYVFGTFELLSGDLDKLTSYRDTCYALGNMMQPVSARRVLPPHGLDKSSKAWKRNINYVRKISQGNMERLDKALLSAVGHLNLVIDRDNSKKRAENWMGKARESQAEIDELVEKLESLKTKAVNELMVAYGVEEAEIKKLLGLEDQSGVAANETV